MRYIGEGSFFLRDDRTLCQFLAGNPCARCTYGGCKSQNRLRHHDRQAAWPPWWAWRPCTPRTAIAKRGLAGIRPQVEARKELNRAYDRFAFTYGLINKTTFGETADGSTIRRMPNLVEVPGRPGRHAGDVAGGG